MFSDIQSIRFIKNEKKKKKTLVTVHYIIYFYNTPRIYLKWFHDKQFDRFVPTLSLLLNK